MSIDTLEQVKCFHCGNECEEKLWINEKCFCCYGCKTVYEILDANNLCQYYDLEKTPGVQLKNRSDETFSYLDEKDIRAKVIGFDSESFAKVTFFIPSIHCVSCIWLLENLHKIREGILHSEVVFTKKIVAIEFNPRQIKLGAIAGLLSDLGYVPKISLDQNDAGNANKQKPLLLKLAVAGFCFGNVMLFSFPEYLGIDHSEKELMRIFSWLNLILAVPAFFYSASDYLTAAAKAFKQKQINIDVPIAAGLIALFFRSAYDIISGTGAGYMDSMTGLVFFLLIGRWFQSKTYESLAFDRDFTSYFPLAVQVLQHDEWKPVIIYNLKKNDHLRIKNMVSVPAVSTLLDELAYIDYSFVTGESKPVKVVRGDLVYAGGRLIGSPINLIVEKATSQSHLTSLWNNEAFRKAEGNKYQKVIDKAARRFTWIVLAIAVVTAIYWQITNPASMWLVLTSVLMVACPCALALAAPFTLGSMLRVMGRNQLYLKNADVIERMASIDTVVFDKTGTVTHGREPEISFDGNLNRSELSAIKQLAGYSTHPISKAIAGSLFGSEVSVVSFTEIPGKGIEGCVDEKTYKIGSATFVGIDAPSNATATRVFVTIDDTYRGAFSIKISIRERIGEMITGLGKKCAALLSGDNNADEKEMRKLFGPATQLLFNQSPHEKLNYIQALQQNGKHVMMIGDGLNDAGALKQSDVGIAVTDDTGVFTPACDGILAGEKMPSLNKMLVFAKSASVILKAGFVISFFYNAISLAVAVTGNLTPLIAAIIMPISSISVVAFSTFAVNISAKKFKL